MIKTIAQSKVGLTSIPLCNKRIGWTVLTVAFALLPVSQSVRATSQPSPIPSPKMVLERVGSSVPLVVLGWARTIHPLIPIRVNVNGPVQTAYYHQRVTFDVLKRIKQTGGPPVGPTVTVQIFVGASNSGMPLSPTPNQRFRQGDRAVLFLQHPYVRTSNKSASRFDRQSRVWEINGVLEPTPSRRYRFKGRGNAEFTLQEIEAASRILPRTPLKTKQ